MKGIAQFITVDRNIQSGQPVFTGSRVPVQSLFWHLEKGISLQEFLNDFPSVKREQAIGVLEIAGKIVSSENLGQIYESVD
jgi:uncharacterized protein (DUF433 family)